MKIYINNFNLLTWPRNMAEILHNQGHEVIFIDNASVYEPLLEWYEKCPFYVHYLERNVGSLAPWKLKLVDNKDFYVVTDPDLDISQVPSDWPDVLRKGIEFYGDKCGLSLDETLVPLENPSWTLDEFYKYPDGNPLAWGPQVKLSHNYYNYPTDTTFAMYPPGSGESISGVRAGRPYTARHLPWHLVSSIRNEKAIQIQINEEIEFYFDHCNTNSRSVTMHRIQPLLKKYKDV